MPGGVTFDRRGEMFVTAQIQQSKPDEESWGHPSNEVLRLHSRDGGRTFGFDLVSEPDDSTSHWLPNIERPTGHNQVPSQPGILYTAGPPGEGLKDLLPNRVYWMS